MADKKFHKRLQEALEALQINSVEKLLEIIQSGEASAQHLKFADDICKRHGVAYDPSLLEDRVKNSISDLPFFTPPEDHLSA